VRLNETRNVVRWDAELWGVCLWEQGIRADLTERTRKTNHTLQDLVYEIELLSKIGQHPNILGFVGANIDTPDAPIIVLEYMDGGCVEDVLTAKSKNGLWRPPKATSYSWYAPAPVQSIRFASLVTLKSITTEA
jgi:hypothetical protein